VSEIKVQTSLKSESVTSRPDWLEQASFLYLLIPFILFCLTWIKLPVGLVVTAILVWLAWRTYSQPASLSHSYPASFRELWPGLLILAFWVFLSGIGGFAFQNYDQHFRNAIFHDLINYQWPVIYHNLANSNQDLMLVYYIGFWLPSALVGKAFGWVAANIALYLWTWLGVSLVTMQISKRLHWPIFYSALLLIFFSGMDALGVIMAPHDYPTLWPPIQHLEWWANTMQYSSFTTQLFWVFNQTVPAMLCIALLINRNNKRYILLIWSLCFFYAPLPALGLFPIAALAILQPSTERSINPSLKKCPAVVAYIKSILLQLTESISFENGIGGGIILAVAFLYFLVNRNSSDYGFFTRGQIYIPDYITFILLEGVLLWIMLVPKAKNRIEWIVVGSMLFLFPWIKVGGSIDFCMRASIPALFYLMIGVGEGLTNKNRALTSILALCLLIGAFTPLYEIDRSVYRTAVYYYHVFKNPPSQNGPVLDNLQGLFLPYRPEKDHVQSLTADYLPSISMLRPDLIVNFAANPEKSIYFKYLLPDR